MKIITDYRYFVMKQITKRDLAHNRISAEKIIWLFYDGYKLLSVMEIIT